jgi:large subunit ribosomal protein L28
MSSMPSEALGQSIKLKLSTQTIRTIEKNGGIDAYLLSTSNTKLTDAAQRLKRKIRLASEAVSAS